MACQRTSGYLKKVFFSVSVVCAFYIAMYGFAKNSQFCGMFCKDTSRSNNHAMIVMKEYLVQDECVKLKYWKNAARYKGKLSLHRWFESCPCGQNIDGGLRIHTRFPREPELETTINVTEFIQHKDSYSNRIFGYITPKISGTYKLAVSSDDFSELWFSTDSSPKNVELVAYVGDPASSSGTISGIREFTKQVSQISKPINLSAGMDYYIEALHRNQGGDGHITIAWQTPGADSKKFDLIDSDLLASYFAEEESLSSADVIRKECIMKDHRPLLLKRMPPITANELRDDRDDYCRLIVPKLNHSLVADVLPTCPYLPSYIPDKKMWRYQAYADHRAKDTDFYPDDKTTGFMVLGEDTRGNKVIEEKEVNEVVQEYMKNLMKSKRRLYELNRVVNMEKKTDVEKGCRYLLELDLRVVGKNATVRLSEFVYRFSTKYIKLNNNTISPALCYPEGFQWRDDPKVYVVVPVKNYGYWIKYLIDELSKIYNNTSENNFHLVVVDFNSTDFNIEEYLRTSVLRNSYTFVEMEGFFFKTLALNTGVATIKDNNSIAFLMDLHITVPPCFFDTIRKHVIKGKAGFFPKVLRLSCGTSVVYPQGYWESMGYGLFGVYKEDWDRFGGEDVEKFRYTWGGEDWDLLDRVISAKIEAERFCWPKLYHFPHGKKGKWYKNSRKKKSK